MRVNGLRQIVVPQSAGDPINKRGGHLAPHRLYVRQQLYGAVAPNAVATHRDDHT
jgi:hypothetical protein